MTEIEKYLLEIDNTLAAEGAGVDQMVAYSADYIRDAPLEALAYIVEGMNDGKVMLDLLTINSNSSAFIRACATIGLHRVLSTIRETIKENESDPKEEER